MYLHQYEHMHILHSTWNLTLTRQGMQEAYAKSDGNILPSLPPLFVYSQILA